MTGARRNPTGKKRGGKGWAVAQSEARRWQGGGGAKRGGCGVTKFRCRKGGLKTKGSHLGVGDGSGFAAGTGGGKKGDDESTMVQDGVERVSQEAQDNQKRERRRRKPRRL